MCWKYSELTVLLGLPQKKDGVLRNSDIKEVSINSSMHYPARSNSIITRQFPGKEVFLPYLPAATSSPPLDCQSLATKHLLFLFIYFEPNFEKCTMKGPLLYQKLPSSHRVQRQFRGFGKFSGQVPGEVVVFIRTSCYLFGCSLLRLHSLPGAPPVFSLIHSRGGH